MRKRSFTALIIALCISLTNVSAAANVVPILPETMNLEVPFEFNIGDQKFSAGKYQLKIDPTSSLIELTNGSNELKRIIGAISSGKKTKNKVSRVVFYQYGDQYFLREVDAPTHSSKLRKSKTEKEAGKSKDKLSKVILNV